MKVLYITISYLILLFTPALHISAQEIIPDKETTYRAEVVHILSEAQERLPGVPASSNHQTLEVKILNGDKEGEVVTVEDDYFDLKAGESLYLTHVTNSVDGKDFYMVGEPYRLTPLLIFGILFVALVIYFGGIQGVRGLIALAGSFVFIFTLLIPGILAGYSPILISVGVASLIIILGSYITHGFNKTTSSAVLGMIATIIVTGIAAYLAVHLSRFTGLSSGESTYLNLNTGGTIDLVGLLLGGILIGLLGVLYDAGIGQAVTVEELHRAGPELPTKTIYTRALRVGREHIGALVNTLALAYVGASLPLILLFMHASQESLLVALNREIFSAEIMRIIIGSIGLVLAVPITTFISTKILVRKQATRKE